MQNLWAPWRATYVLGQTESAGGCIFCIKPARGPEHHPEELILAATPDATVMLNAFPYNNGHLLVAPRAHVARVGALDAAAHDAFFRVVTATSTLIEQVLAPQGINIGMNLGHVAGAGIADHAHVHIVPRWHGDTNFMALLAETRVISQHLQETYAILRPHFESWDGAAGAAPGARPPA